MSEHDLVVRGGTVVDGTGAPARTADVAVSDGVVTEVGRVDGRGHREIEADGLLVTPGFVDIHTHYDGQATWDPHLAPSSWHGVTTVVMGNCGVGFAPVFPEHHERLIQLMEGVEDIPGTALHEGLTWEWETFAEYLDHLDGRERDIDLGAQVPHGPVRLHVMGERGATQEPATPADVEQMAAIVRDAVRAGALGFTTSRTLNHRTSLGEYTPTLKAELDELAGIASGLAEADAGVLQVVSDFLDLDDEYGLLREMAVRSGRPLSISVAQNPRMPGQWRELLDAFAADQARGIQVRGQVAARAVGLLVGFQGTLNPFMHTPAYRDVADLPLGERVAHLRHPEVRRTILDGMVHDKNDHVLGSRLVTKWQLMFPLGDPPDYEPDPATSVAAVAAREGRDPAEVAYDLLLGDEGRAFLYLPTLNWADRNLDVVGEQLAHPMSVPGLSDGGAHVGTICDVSFPTTLLTLWGRDRADGRLPVETLIHKQCRATAETVGLFDRGLLAPGHVADLNVIDFEHLTAHAPEMAYDLPGGSKRLLQRASGYVHTVKNGVGIMAGGEATGELPGQLLRGARPSPAS